MKRLAAITFCLLAFFTLPAFSQGPPDCTFTGSNFTTTGVPTNGSISNLRQNTPCNAWAVTFSVTGTLAATVQFVTSPDNTTWTAVPNTVCSASVFAPCMSSGTNPIATLAKQGVGKIYAYGAYVRVNVTNTSGSGQGNIRVYGYKGTTASIGGSGGGGGGGGTPASPDRSVQFNNAGAFGGSADFTYMGGRGMVVGAPDVNITPSYNLTGNLDGKQLESYQFYSTLNNTSGVGDPLLVYPFDIEVGVASPSYLDYISLYSGVEYTGTDTGGVLGSTLGGIVTDDEVNAPGASIWNLIGMRNNEQVRSGTVANVYGYLANVVARGGTITEANGIRPTVQTVASSSSHIGLARAAFLRVVNQMGTIDNAVGLEVGDITGGGTSNFAIKTGLGRNQFGDVIQQAAVGFSALPSVPSNGDIIYCSDCTVTSGIDNTCTSGGNGANAARINGAWKCTQ